MEIITGADKKILRTVCKPVEKFDVTLKKLAEEMEETMLAQDPETEVKGVGLAAPQIGVNARFMLVTFHVGRRRAHKVIPMTNPEILEFSKDKVLMEEGCLSLPGMFGKVLRPAKIRVRWQNLDGRWCEKKLEHWDARVFQHEYDHLEGVLFIDYLKEEEREEARAF